MDWRFNTIWFEQLEQDKIFQKDFKENIVATENKTFENSEYAIIWHLKEKLKSFDNLPENDRLSYLELNWANIKNFDGIEMFRNLKRLELHYCVKLENDFGLSRLKDSIEFLHINTSKKFKFTDELLQLKKLKVLCLNACGPIDNLEFLKNFPNLIDFRFVDTKILDGNLKPILEHPTIRTVGFLNKKHYNYKDEKLKLELEKKFDSEYKTIVYKGHIDMTMRKITAANSRFAKAAVSCFNDSEVLISSFVPLMKFSAENPRLRKAVKPLITFS